MKERAPEQKPRIPTYYTKDWEEAGVLVRDLTRGSTLSHGTWHYYPEDYTQVAKDAWSGEGTGYILWRNENNKMKEIAANINIGVTPPSYAEDGPEVLADSFDQAQELKEGETMYLTDEGAN